jgi:hypothetical protein
MAHNHANMSPEELAELTMAAKNATEDGSLYGRKWWILKGDGIAFSIENIKQQVSDAYGQVIYNDAAYIRLSLEFYSELIDKFQAFNNWNKTEKSVQIRMKGGNAAAIHARKNLTDQQLIDLFGFSDLDVEILINPKMPQAEFDTVYDRACNVANQVMATHKRRLDRGFFKNNVSQESDYFFGDDIKNNFRKTIASTLDKVELRSCFESDIVRNKCSNTSCIITDTVHGDKVRIEAPHFPRAERIPLGYSPVVGSINDTIRLKTEGTNGHVVDMNLMRLKLGNIIECEEVRRVSMRYNEKEDRVKVHFIVPYKKVFSDFIDLAIPRKGDSGLADFAMRGGFFDRLNIVYNVFGYLVTLPTLQECRDEYYKLMFVYDNCPDCKKEKRQQKYNILTDLINHQDKQKIAAMKPLAIRKPYTRY